MALQTVSEMEVKLCRVSEELSRQTELQRSAVHRAQLAEQQVQDLRERLHSLEAELLTADVQRDGLRHNTQHASIISGECLVKTVSFRLLYKNGKPDY